MEKAGPRSSGNVYCPGPGELLDLPDEILGRMDQEGAVEGLLLTYAPGPGESAPAFASFVRDPIL